MVEGVVPAVVSPCEVHAPGVQIPERGKIGFGRGGGCWRRGRGCEETGKAHDVLEESLLLIKQRCRKHLFLFRTKTQLAVHPWWYVSATPPPVPSAVFDGIRSR